MMDSSICDYCHSHLFVLSVALSLQLSEESVQCCLFANLKHLRQLIENSQMIGVAIRVSNNGIHLGDQRAHLQNMISC